MEKLKLANIGLSYSGSWCGFVECLTGENFGFGQNTGETLPNFRQKSKGILKIIETRRVKRSFLPDICQVSDTHRTWLEFQSEI